MSGSTSRKTRRRSVSEAEAISRVVQRLRQQFPEVPPEALEEVVNGHYEAFDGRPVRNFVAVLVERATRAELQAGAPAGDIAHCDWAWPGSVGSADSAQVPGARE